MNVPLVKVKVLLVVVAISKASAKLHVPPTPSNVSGRSMIFPLLVMVLVPLVAAKVIAVPLPVGIVMPDAMVSEPSMVFGNVGPVPVYPVKSKLLTSATLVKVIPLAPDPAEIQMLGKLAREPAEMVLLVAEPSVVLMVEVDLVSVSPVVFEVSQTVPMLVNVHVPEPMVNTLVAAPADETIPALTF